jgi:cobalt-zinc-cadmium efflux system protein
MSGHVHGARPASVLLRCLLLTLGFAAVEAAAGLWAGSLALVSDAGHMVTDSGALALALVAARVAERRPSRRFTYGLGRVEVVAAVLNGVVMCALVAWIVVEAVGRLHDPRPVDGAVAMTVAGLGLVVNLVVARVLVRGERTLNTRAALLHVLGDLLGSVAALASGAVVLATGWFPIDPILSFVICGLVLVSALRILREGVFVLLEGAPTHLDVERVAAGVSALPGVREVHDLHVWTVASDRTALSAHVVLDDAADWEDVLRRAHGHLFETWGIDHATLQPEREGGGSMRAAFRPCDDDEGDGG